MISSEYFKIDVDKKNNLFWFMVIFLFNLCTFSFLSYWLPINYETNDDIVMMLLSSGRYTGNYESGLIFINYILGGLIAYFYSMSSCLEWYTIILAFIYLISITIITLFFLKKNSSTSTIFLCVLLLKCIEYYFVTNFQFTIVAGFAAIAGFLLLDTKKTSNHIIGFLLLITASLVRFHILPLLIFLLLPGYLWKNKQMLGIPFLRNSATILLVGSILVGFMLNYLNNEKYSHDFNNPYFAKLTSARAYVTDSSLRDLNTLRYIPYPLKIEEIAHFQYHFYDPQLFDFRIINELSLALTSRPFLDKLRSAFHLIMNDFFKYFLLCALVIIVFIAGFESKIDIFFIISIFILFFLLCLYISMDLYLKHRVFYVIFFTFLLSLFSTFKLRDTTPKYMIFMLCFMIIFFGYFALPRNLFFLFMFSVSILYYFTHLKDKPLKLFTVALLMILSFMMIDRANWSKHGKYDQILAEQINMINRNYLKTKRFVVPCKAELFIEGLDPIKFNKVDFTKTVCFNGWMASTQFSMAKMPSFKSFKDRASLFLSVHDTVYVKAVIKGVEKHYGLRLHPVVDIHNEHFQIVSFREH